MVMVMVMIMVMLTVRTGRGIHPSTTRLAMVAAAGLAEYHSPPQIPS
jgi:hypothetical protein